MKALRLILVVVLLTSTVSVTYGAHLYFYPNDIKLTNGQKATIDLRIDTGDKTINAGEISGELIGKGVRITSLESTNSVFRLFIDVGSKERSFMIVGGAPGGFSGAGVIARIGIEAVETGSSTLMINEKSRILLHDGRGTVDSLVSSVAYISVESRPENYILITSKSHPDESLWYNANDLLLHWDITPSAEYSYVFGNDINAEPDNIPDHPEGKLLFLGDVRIADLPDGVYYFALKQLGADIISRFKIMQDRQLPEFQQAVINKGGAETGGKPALVFFATDELSGISHYEIRFDGDDFEIAQSPLILSRTYKRITLRAYDRAGNIVEKDLYSSAGLMDFGLLLLILILVLILLYIVRNEHAKHLKKTEES